LAKTTPKTKAWAAFSRYIRLRDAVLTTGGTEYGKCYTCGKVIPVKGSHAGHWISRHRLGVFMNEHNVHLQCAGCNLYGNGREVEYQAHLLKDYGEDILSCLTRAAGRTYVKLRADDWRELEAEYKRRAEFIAENEYVPEWKDAYMEKLREVV
jgi:hypothetical protein